jgi:hypothetical protein
MRLALVFAAMAAAACHKAAPAAGTLDSSADASSGAVRAAAEAGPIAPSRCEATGSVVTVGGRDVELGDAVALESGVAVGLVHGGGEGRVAAVGFLDRDVSAIRVVDLGRTLGDAPGPRLAKRGADVIAASYGLRDSGPQRELRVTRVGPGGEARVVAVVAEKGDDSLAFDITGGMVAWDEVREAQRSEPSPYLGLAAGVVRVAPLLEDRAGAPRDVSPPSSDAEMPRLVAAGSGTFVFWLARQADPPGARDAAASEVAGEVRASSWLEMVAVDAAGSPLGPVRRLTPTTGHVSSYDVRLLGGPERGSRTLEESGPERQRASTALVVARDDGESVDGSGGTLWRIRVGQDLAELSLVPADGLGRGAPAVLEAPQVRQRAEPHDPTAAWLVWASYNEELRLLPLDATGEPAGPPSAEPGLGESWPLAVAADAGRLLVAVAPAKDRAAELRVFSCLHSQGR